MLDFERIKMITNLDKKSLIERTLKLTEEVGEIFGALKNNDDNNLMEECIDTTLICISIIYQITDIEYEDSFNIFNISYETNKKNSYEKEIYKKIIEDKVQNLGKQIGKVSEAVLSYSKVSCCGYKEKSTKDVVNELLILNNYVRQIIINLKKIHHIKDEEISDLINIKINKWYSKCMETRK